jgi:regulator of protease activity HflC (stomatin/prohibitin superfamily)
VSFGKFLVLILVGSLIAAVWRRLKIVTVHDFQHALRFRRGNYSELLGPGIYWYLQPLSSIEILDKRPTYLTVPGQELLSSDSVTLKVSTLVEYQISDPKVAILESEDYLQAIYAKVQIQLRTLISTRAIEELLVSRLDLSNSLKATLGPELKALGVEVRSVAIKDIMLPGNLRAA